MLKFLLLLIVLSYHSSEGLVNPCRKGQTANQFFPHPESESKYIHCTQWGQAFEFACANGLVFNPSALTCERKETMQFFQNFVNALQSSNFESTTRKVPRINPVFQTQPTTVDTELPFEPTTKFFLPSRPVNRQNSQNFIVSSTPRAFTFPSSTFSNILPVEQTPRAFTFPQNERTTTNTFITTTTATTTLAAPITTTTTTTPITTTTTHKTTLLTTSSANPVSITAGAANVQTDSTRKQQTFSSNDCSTFSVSNSAISTVNGIYTQLNPNLFRRSDNFRIPGLIVHLGQSKWCLTLTFFTADLNSITVSDIESQCGANLECCMLISTSPDTLGITDPKREWNINILDFKGQKDEEISFDCKNIQKICPRIPFCPPECLKNVDGCDVCECDGKPFFTLNSQPNTQNAQSQPAVTQSTTLPSTTLLISLPSSTLSTTTFTTLPFNPPTTTRPAAPVAQSFSPVTLAPLATVFAQQNNNRLLFTTRSSFITRPPFIQPSFRMFQPSQVPFAQRLSALKNTDKVEMQVQKEPESVIVKTCDMVKCSNNLICAEANNCKNCNPMCFPEKKFDLFSGIKLSCANVVCGINSTCVFDIKDQLLKCVQLAPIKPTQVELDVQALVNLHDIEQFENTVKKHLPSSTIETTTTTTTDKMNLVLNNQLTNSNFTVRTCSMVKCPNDLMCAEAVNCQTCNPLCFPNNHIDLSKAVRPGCESVICPGQMKCLFDTKESNLKCVA